MSRAEGDGNRRHYQFVRDGHAEHQHWQQWRLVWAEIAKVGGPANPLGLAIGVGHGG